MSKSVKINGTTYSGVSRVSLPLSSDTSQYAQFQDVDEISVPTGSIEISANGTYNVFNYASATVNVPTSGGGGSTSSFLELVSSNTTTHSEDWSSNKKVADFAKLYCNVEDETDEHVYIVDIINTFSGNNAGQRLIVWRRVGEPSTFTGGNAVNNLIWLRATRTNEVTPHWGGVSNNLTVTTSTSACDYGSTPNSLTFLIGANSTITVKKYSINWDWEG